MSAWPACVLAFQGLRFRRRVLMVRAMPSCHCLGVRCPLCRRPRRSSSTLTWCESAGSCLILSEALR
eukprot:4406959-Amphidinium_carterae.1